MSVHGDAVVRGRCHGVTSGKGLGVWVSLFGLGASKRGNGPGGWVLGFGG